MFSFLTARDLARHESEAQRIQLAERPPPASSQFQATMSVHANHAHSDEAHLAVEYPIAMLFYSMGIQNAMAGTRNWWRRLAQIEQDVRRVFESDYAVQGLFISEFGNMFQSIDSALAPWHHQNTQELFEAMLATLGLDHIKVYADPPYVALVDADRWHVESCEKLSNLCAERDI